jgi:uncharacterized protein YxjI
MSHEDLLDSHTKTRADFKEFDFPLTFQFKLGTISNDFTAKDSSGQTIAYVRQKMFKLKDAIMVFSDETKTNQLYTIKADRIIDFNASYEFTDANDTVLGSIGRKGMRSLWKAHYEIFDANKLQEYHVREQNPWAKVADVLFSEIPIVGMFTGYMFNPKYEIVASDGTIVARLSKEKSFFGRIFKLEKLAEFKSGDSERLLLALMMMMLLERRRG